MNIQELKQLTKEELSQKLAASQEKLHFVREEVMAGKDKNHAQLRGLKKEIAQIATCISELSRS